MPLSNYAKSKIVASKYAKLHVGDPGPDCNGNPAVNTLRVPVDLDPNHANAEALQWPLCPAGETFTHVSLWDDLAAGNPWISGPLASPGTVAINQLFEIAAGKLKVDLK